MRCCYIILLWLLPVISFSQLKIHVSAGTNLSTNYDRDGFYVTNTGTQIYNRNGSYSSKSIGEYITGEVTFETRLNNNLSAVSGLMFIQSGYTNHDASSNGVYLFTSKLEVSYLSIPFLLRINFVNAFYLDVGFIGMIPLKAELEEVALAGSPQEIRAKGDIHSYLNPSITGTYWQASLVINRFLLSYYFIISKNTVDNDLENNWQINSNQSIFLLDHQPRLNYWFTGIKLGIRVK